MAAACCASVRAGFVRTIRDAVSPGTGGVVVVVGGAVVVVVGGAVVVVTGGAVVVVGDGAVVGGVVAVLSGGVVLVASLLGAVVEVVSVVCASAGTIAASCTINVAHSTATTAQRRVFFKLTLVRPRARRSAKKNANRRPTGDRLP